MLNKTFQKALGFLQTPTKTFAKEKSTEVMEAFLYMAILSVVAAVMSGLVLGFSTPAGVLIVTTIVTAYIGGIVLSVIAGLWLHLWAYIFGAKKGVGQTLKAIFYGGTPSYLLGWIPFIGIIIWLWSVFLQWKGLSSLQGITREKAALSIIVAFIIPMILMLILAMVALALLAPFIGSGLYPDMFPGFPMSS
jgi:hypothetical protein